MTGRTVLRIAAGIEIATLAMLLANLFTLHVPEVSRIIGPAHGLAYMATVICAALIADGRHRVWLLALVPAVGGLLAVRLTGRPPGALGRD